jgi:hypothetical protein
MKWKKFDIGCPEREGGSENTITPGNGDRKIEKGEEETDITNGEKKEWKEN